MKRKYTNRFTLSLMSTLLPGLSSGALAATTWTEARVDAMGAPAKRQPTMALRRSPTRRCSHAISKAMISA